MSRLLLNELRHFSRPFRIDGRNIQVLHTPENYFKALKVRADSKLTSDGVEIIIIYGIIHFCFTEWNPDSKATGHLFLTISWHGK